ncbi:sensor histidine kinase [Kineosporia babensis]|uniref:histidine kinase n=1 Tax=Kineosporia babensis TaxID=499548 RepID=A0A9X1NEY8_9ACTN|nr:histidine kinase [Kineosporia babensis]MCD5312830.1 histidine kinase [Kineosporia babensis]
MPTLTRSVQTWWQAARRASRGRLVYECCLALFCALTTAWSVVGLMPWTSDSLQLTVAVLTALITLVLTPLRLTRPVTAMVLAALVSIPGGGSSLAVSVFAFAVGYRSKKAWAVAFGFLVALLCSIAGIFVQDASDPLFIVLIAVVIFCFMTILPGAIAAILAQRRLLVMTMNQRNIELHEQQQVVAGQAQARERNRIAAELHDSLGHRLTLISLYAGGLAQSATPAPAAGETSALVSTSSASTENARSQAVGLLRDTSAQAMGELRQILKVLHQDGPADGARTLQEVEPTVASARQTGTPIELVRAGQPRPLPMLAEHAAYRVVQEGITNALKHARGAPIRVEVRYDEDALFVEVRNRPGLPYPGSSTGQGLHGLTERVRLAGGVLSHGPLEDGDFRLGAVLPYDAEVPEPKPVANGDFRQQISKVSRRQKLGVAGIVVTVLVGMSSCVGSFFALGIDEPVDRGVYLYLQPGDSMDRMRHLLPAQPMSERTNTAGDICRMYSGSGEEETGDSNTTIDYELCFKDEVLVSKRTVETELTP